MVSNRQSRHRVGQIPDCVKVEILYDKLKKIMIRDEPVMGGAMADNIILNSRKLGITLEQLEERIKLIDALLEPANRLDIPNTKF